MRLLRSFPALAFALVLLSIAGVCAAQRSIGLLLVAGTLAAISWSVTEGPRGRTLPRWVSNILVIGVCLNVIRDMLQNPGDVMGVLGRFTLMLTLIKLYERRTARDYAQLLMLSLVLMITGCMLSSDLIFGIVLLLYVMLGLYVLLLHQLYSSYERSRDERNASIPAGYRLAPPVKPIIGRHPGLHFRLSAAAIGLAGVALSLGVFVGFPRGIGIDLFGSLSGPALNRSAGFAWQVNLAAGGRINRSTSRLFTVQFLEDDKPQRFAGPVYLRGAVLDRYEGDGLWTTFEGMVRRYHMTPGRSENLGIGDSGHMIVQQFTYLRALSGEMPLLSIYAPVGLEVESTVDVLYDPRRQTLRSAQETRRMVGYSVRAQTDPSNFTLQAITNVSKPFGRIGWFNSSRGGPVQPKDRALVEEKARALLVAAGLPAQAPSFNAEDPYSDAWEWNRAAARAFTDYLHSSEFTYTLDLGDIRIRSGEDPIVSFLFTNKRGHCEYFASAFAALCHSVGVPARIVVGYLAQRYDESARQYVVLEGNAHAWVEVATGPYAWSGFDPTPPGSLPNLSEDAGTLAQTVRSVYNRFEGDWSSSVVGYDTSAQDRLMSSLGQGWTRRITAALEAVRTWMENVNVFFNVGPGGYIWMGIVATALVIAVIALIKLMRRSLAMRRTLHLQHLRGAEYRRMLAQLGFYLDMLRVLKRGRLAKPPWRPPLNHAAALEPEQPQPARLVHEITGVFYEARYGSRPVDRARLQQARAAVRELAQMLRVRV